MSGVVIHAGISSSYNLNQSVWGSAIDPLVIVLWGNDPKFRLLADAPCEEQLADRLEAITGCAS